VRLTGGEPLVRKGIVELVRQVGLNHDGFFGAWIPLVAATLDN
jgi:hypothetical protein